MLGSTMRLLWKALASALLGLALILAVAYGWFVFHGPAPSLWHTARLEAEFTAADEQKVGGIAGYKALEDRLYAELQTEVLDKVQPEDRIAFNRYSRGSRSDPAVWDVNWNRTFEITPPHPVGAALLLHGLTDSPYSMRSMAAHLAARGLKVVALRLPGHGAAVSGLLTFEVEDMQAAVRLAMRDLRRQLGPDVPIYMVGYSNGAALSVDYALDVVGGADLPEPAGLILMSPAIAISPFAIVARLRTGLSSVPGFGRAAWQVIETEFDPYKYSSFSFHAAGETQRLTSGIDDKVQRLFERGPIHGFPPTLIFQSTVDATVLAPAVVDVLLEHLAPERHELVLFDLNRLNEVQPLLVRDPGPLTGKLLSAPSRSYTLTVLTNATPETLEVRELRAAPGSALQAERPLPWSWPRDVFSLSHVSIPFPPDDPLYGYDAPRDTNHVQLGRVRAHGENGVLALPDWVITRQRSNPFHGYMMERIDGFLSATGLPVAGPAPGPVDAPPPG